MRVFMNRVLVIKYQGYIIPITEISFVNIERRKGTLSLSTSNYKKNYS